MQSWALFHWQYYMYYLSKKAPFAGRWPSPCSPPAPSTQSWWQRWGQQEYITNHKELYLRIEPIILSIDFPRNWRGAHPLLFLWKAFPPMFTWLYSPGFPVFTKYCQAQPKLQVKLSIHKIYHVAAYQSPQINHLFLKINHHHNNPLIFFYQQKLNHL